MQSVHVHQLYPRWLVKREKGESCNIIDVRTPAEYCRAHVPGARLISLNTLMARGHEIEKEGDVFLICQSGMRSAQAAVFLAQQFGHTNVINVEGGTMAWVQAGYPVEQGGER